jgi:hypothetical protein
MTDASIDAFLARYTPEIATAAQACRGKLRALFPRGYELVYDNYNALVFAFASTDRSSGAILSVAAYPRWVTLFFADGVSLADPKGLLQGDGVRVRGIRLQTPDDLDGADVLQFIAQAMAPHRQALTAAQPLQTIVKSVSAKQRPRRP